MNRIERAELGDLLGTRSDWCKVREHEAAPGHWPSWTDKAKPCDPGMHAPQPWGPTWRAAHLIFVAHLSPFSKDHLAGCETSDEYAHEPFAPGSATRCGPSPTDKKAVNRVEFSYLHRWEVRHRMYPVSRLGRGSKGRPSWTDKSKGGANATPTRWAVDKSPAGSLECIGEQFARAKICYISSDGLGPDDPNWTDKPRYRLEAFRRLVRRQMARFPNPWIPGPDGLRALSPRDEYERTVQADARRLLDAACTRYPVLRGFRVPDEMPCPDGPRLFSSDSGMRERFRKLEGAARLLERKPPAIYAHSSLRSLIGLPVCERGKPAPEAWQEPKEPEYTPADARCTLGLYQTHYPAYTMAEIEQARRDLEHPRKPYRIELDPRTSHFGTMVNGEDSAYLFPAGTLEPPIQPVALAQNPGEAILAAAALNPADVQVWIDGVQLQGPVLEPGEYLEPRPAVATVKLAQPSVTAEALGFVRMCRGDLTTVWDGERMVTTCNACGASEIGTRGPIYCTRYVL